MPGHCQHYCLSTSRLVPKTGSCHLRRTFGSRIGHKRTALLAHDNEKGELPNWARRNVKLLDKGVIHATVTSARLLEESLGTKIRKLQSGPLRGTDRLAP